MFIANATLTSKGQITIPKRVREKLGVTTGDQISFVIIGDEIRITKSFLDILKEMQEGFKGLAEELGVKNEEDVQKLVDEVRHQR